MASAKSFNFFFKSVASEKGKVAIYFGRTSPVLSGAEESLFSKEILGWVADVCPVRMKYLPKGGWFRAKYPFSFGKNGEVDNKKTMHRFSAFICMYKVRTKSSQLNSEKSQAKMNTLTSRHTQNFSSTQISWKGKAGGFELNYPFPEERTRRSFSHL